MVQGFPVTSTLTDTAFQEHIPKLKGDHGRAWILGGPRKSPEVLRWPSHSLCRFWENLTSTDLSEHVAAQGYRLPSDHPELLVCDEWPGTDTWMPVTQTYMISGPVPGQLLGSTSQTAPTTLHRTALLDFAVHRKRVLSPYRIYNKPKGHMYW